MEAAPARGAASLRMNADARLIELETKVSYQEKLLEDLDRVVAEQAQQLDQLERHLARLVESLRAGPGPAAERHEEPPPPHY